MSKLQREEIQDHFRIKNEVRVRKTDPKTRKEISVI